jgi:hypothetical protein
MRKALRVLGFTLLAFVAIGLVVAAAFWFTIPPTPDVPADFEASIPADTAVTQPALRLEVLQMYWLDQAVRDSTSVAGMTDLQSAAGIWRLLQVGVRTQRVDRPNAESVKEIVAAQGWPTKEAVGVDGVHATFMIVQHANFDPELQRAALGPLREGYEAGHVSGQQLAMNTDRVRLADGKGQLYGTQFGAVAGAEITLSPIEDEPNVDARRAELGLPPLAEYLARICSEEEICMER